MVKKLVCIVLLASHMIQVVAGDFVPDALKAKARKADGIAANPVTLEDNRFRQAPGEVMTPLMNAVRTGTPKSVKELLERGEALNERSNETGETCFHELAMSSNPEAVAIAELLINHQDRDLTIVKEAYDLAVAQQNDSLAAKLLSALPLHIDPATMSEKKQIELADANWHNRPKKRYSSTLEKNDSTWSSIAKYFFGGMGLAATLYYAYDKFFKKKSAHNS